MVKDKINYRAAGPRTLLTRQTNQGRANDGGLRIGEMERDGVIAHGLSSFLQDSMMKRGDEYKLAVCNQSGTIAIYNKVMNHFYSPSVDGPIAFDLENDAIPTLITKYGKDFSIVNIPYSFKLLMQELTAMNVQMRLITADNIDQLTSMSKKTLSEVLNVKPDLKPEKEKKKHVTLSELNNELSSINAEYLSKYNSLREKYKYNEPPEGSQDKYELEKLQQKYERKREENFTLSKSVNKDKIADLVAELEQLQIEYDQLLKTTRNESNLSRIRMRYKSKMDDYNALTGDDYEPLRLALPDVPNIEQLQKDAGSNTTKSKEALSQLKLLGVEEPYQPSTPEFAASSPLYEVPNSNETPSPPYHVETSSNDVKVVKLDKPANE
jgi:DNA-directed RNA polymerase II subunit RPB2